MAFNKRKYPLFWAAILFALLFFAACSVNKAIPEGRILIKKNKVVVKNYSNHRKLTDAKEQLFLKPNRKILADKVPFFLWHYVYLTPRNIEKGDTSRRDLRRLIRREAKLNKQKLEAPQLIDTGLINLSSVNLKNYFINNGYLLAQVSSRIDTVSRKKAKVIYTVNAGPLHKLTSFFVDSSNLEIHNALIKIVDSLGKTKEVNTFTPWQASGISYEELNLARKQLAVAMQNRGYFLFNAAQIYYKVDTISALNEVDPYRIKITLFYNETNNPYSLKKFNCSKIVLNVNSADSTGISKQDTFNGKIVNSNYNKLDNEFLSNLIEQQTGSTFNQSNISKTIQNLNDLGVFDRTDFIYNFDTLSQQIELQIFSEVGKRKSLSAEPQGLFSPRGTANVNGFNTTTQNRSFGLAFVMNYTNKNIRKHAQRLSLNSITSYEAVIKRSNVQNIGTAFQQGLSASYSVPHYNGIGRIDKFMENKLGFISRKTIFNSNLQFEKNINFNRIVIPVNWTVQFSKTNTDLIIVPIEFSYSLNKVDPDYLSSLNLIDSRYVLSVFTNNVTSPFRVQLNTIKYFISQKAYIQFNSAGETSGNLFRQVNKWADNNFQKSKSYTFFNQQYFQYVKLDAQITVNKRIDALNSFAFRIKGGKTTPYGNSIAVPYDKRYFIGGSNSLRAWAPRQMGPGTKPENSNSIIDRSGEFLMEANFEYRFVVSRNMLEMALFYDAGNIWNTGANRQPPNTPGVLYDVSQITDEIAMDAGVGFRFDFKFFIFRLDWAWSIFDPGKDAKDRWVMTTFPSPSFKNTSKYISKETALAIGIGYPF